MSMLTKKETARYLGVSLSHLDKMIREKLIPFYQVSKRHKKFKQEDIETFLSSCLVKAS
jgi:excisionase family DNA binding protein